MLFEVVTSAGRVVLKTLSREDAELVKNAWNLGHAVDSGLAAARVRVVVPSPSLN